MNANDKQEILEYIEKFSGVFSDMMQEVSRRMLTEQLSPGFRMMDQDDALSPSDIVGSVKVDPQKFIKQQLAFMEKQQQLWENASRAFMGESVEPSVSQDKNDQRFSDSDWEGNPMFSYIKQSYLLNSEYMHQMVDVLEFEDKKVEDQVRFYTRQFINTVSPTNYVLTNPEVCREILETKGESLAKGIDNFMKDLENSPSDAFKITQVDLSAFEMGKDLAATPGKVVFENTLIQLIQYAPTTEKVKAVPLLIIPPFINKYYILDLNEKKSFVSWLVGQGYTVFMVSWVNPDESLGDVTFDDYVELGVMASLDAVESIAKSSKVNMAGYCVGGTLLGITAAYLAKLNDTRIGSITLLTTLLDFSDPGEVGNYISPQMYKLLEHTVENKGYFDGRTIALGFSLLRENNLFWSFFIDNYLKGKDPTPFDILYWNSDSTNIPGAAFLYYLKNMYIENRLINEGEVSIKGVPIDLAACEVPKYCLAAMADHIVLWPSAYQSATALSGDLRFVLTESGHVAGVVNPADKGKYPHWVNAAMPDDHRDWLASAEQKGGSWWVDWQEWLSTRSGEDKAPPKMGNRQYSPVEDAPGSYVKKRLELFA